MITIINITFCLCSGEDPYAASKLAKQQEKKIHSQFMAYGLQIFPIHLNFVGKLDFFKII